MDKKEEKEIIDLKCEKLNICYVKVSTNGQKYSTIKNGTSAGGMSVRNMNSTYNSLIVNYTGNTNIPNGTYIMYTTYSDTSFRLTTGVLPNYFQGGTLV